ncbi:MAG: c-type cytochrome [Planctomycetales bacterium]|nr:c-type cytochrome [Planctomycetales bacterium]
MLFLPLRKLSLLIVVCTPLAWARAETVQLGDASLTSGIPGEGPVTLEQARAWLDQPANHRTLSVELPSGLASGKDGIRIPKDNPLTRAKIELGRQLYFDRRLSKNAEVSCADCHHPSAGYARETRFGVGVAGQEGNRNSPTAYNRILSEAQFWDGRAESLEAQAVGPIANPIEMASTHDVAVQFVKSNAVYRLQFERIFGQPPHIDDIGRALAAFERVIVTGDSPYDAYEPLLRMEQLLADDLEDLPALKEDEPELYERYMAAKRRADAQPMSESAKRGRKLFFGAQANCSACHVGVNFTDEKYHNLGVGMDVENPDLGRFTVTGLEADKGAFKTPTLRNVEQTAPYMHDGSQKTLREVVDWYVQGGHPNPYLSDKIKKFEASEQDRQDLVAFMKALTGPLPEVQEQRLPQD